MKEFQFKQNIRWRPFSKWQTLWHGVVRAVNGFIILNRVVCFA